MTFNLEVLQVEVGVQGLAYGLTILGKLGLNLVI
jgi:hypothetical protein